MTSEPRLSVILPVHNGMPYLPETMASVLGQSFRDFELIVVDDASTDDTSRYVLALDDPRIRYERVERAGLAEAPNHGIRIARSDLIARIDADDIAEPARLERQYDRARSHEDVLIGCQVMWIDPQGNELEPMPSAFPVADQAIRFRMLFACPFLHAGVMYRRRDVLAVGGYDRQFELAAEDYHLWTRLAARGPMVNLPDRLVRYRIHPGSVSSRRWQIQFDLASRAADIYARTICPEVPAGHFEWLNRMLRLEQCPPHEMLPGLIETFDRLRMHFESEGAVPETQEQIRIWRARLGAACMMFARQSRFRVARAIDWIRAARHFEPGIGWGRRLYETLPSRRGIQDRLRAILGRPAPAGGHPGAGPGDPAPSPPACAGAGSR